MFKQQKKRKGFTAAGEMAKAFSFMPSKLNRLMILNSVWEKEAGRMSAYWQLDAVQDGVIFVRARTPVAAQELSLRSMSLIRSLNRYFQRPWITAIKRI